MKPPTWNDLSEELKYQYTMKNSIGIEHWYWDQSVGGKVETFSEETIQKYIKCAKQKKTDYGTYGNTDVWLHEAFDLVSVEGKSVAIMGSIAPWYECMTIAYGGFPTTIEYNLPNYNSPLICEMLLSEMMTTDQKFDFGVSISSFEHDGLGRYGDPLNPDGDLRAMSEMKKIIKPGGFLFLAVPIGLDKIVWNAHRIYGNARLPLLIAEWNIVGAVGFSEYMLSTDTREGGAYQPIIVLQNI